MSATAANLELARRFERRSRTYEARALPTELHQHKTLEAAGRIALPMICFAGRCLAVLATPPQTLERSTGIAPVLPDWRSGVLLLYELRPGASSESRTRVIGLEARGTSRYTMLASTKIGGRNGS